MLAAVRSCRGRRRLGKLAEHVHPTAAAAAAAEPPPLTAEEKEAALRAEAASWEGVSSDPAQLAFATPSEIPTIDLSAYHAAGCEPGEALEQAAAQLRDACESIGFHYITGHGVSDAELAAGFAAADTYHSLPLDEKLDHEMDVVTTHPSGAGYLPLSNWKLPKPEKPNLVEAYVIKREHGPRDVTLDKMPWPPTLGEDFRAEVESYAATMEALAMRMLPIYARALDLPADYFAPAFVSPLWRLRFNRYPAKLEGYEEKEFGISPHVDTSFFTILAQGAPGLCVHDQQHSQWVRAPVLPGALLVNTGELLRSITNDTWLATRHYALHAPSSAGQSSGTGGGERRLSIPFFFNATADYKQAVVPSKVSEGSPAKYPPVRIDTQATHAPPFSRHFLTGNDHLPRQAQDKLKF